MGDRYAFDFKICTPSKGWAQLDTRQDAPYYGTWVNPFTWELVSYCEGDITHTKCADEVEFAKELTRTIIWHKERQYFIGIDPMGNEDIQLAFERLGFTDALH